MFLFRLASHNAGTRLSYLARLMPLWLILCWHTAAGAAGGEYPGDRIEELTRIIRNEQKDTKQVDALNEMAELMASSDKDKAKSYAEKAQKMAIMLSYEPGLARAQANLGSIFAFQYSRFDEAADQFADAYELYQKLYKAGRISATELYEFINNKVLASFKLLVEKENKGTLSRKEKKAIKDYRNLQADFAPVLAEIAKYHERELRSRESKLDSASMVLSSSKTELMTKERELAMKEMELLNKNRVLSSKTREKQLLSRMNNELADSLRNTTDSLRYVLDSLESLSNFLEITTETLLLHEMRLQQESMKAKEEQANVRRLEQEKSAQTAWIYAITSGLLLVVGGVVVLIYYLSSQKKINSILQAKNEQISLQSAEIMEQNANILAQKEEIEAQRDKIHAKNQQITASMNYAQRIQQAILPSPELIALHLPESFVFFRPRDLVSGDFYWFEVVKDKIVIAAVDCTGHGVPGAFMSMIGNKILDEVVIVRGITEPDEILHELHNGVVSSLRQEDTGSRDGMDIALCVIDTKKNTLSYAGAKNPLIYFHSDELFEIKGDKVSIGGGARSGKEEDFAFTKHIIEITAPTSFYIFSDGLQDQFGGKEGRKLMIRSLRNKLAAIYDRPMEVQRQYIEEAIDHWMHYNGQHYRQVDDMLLIGFRLYPSAEGKA